MQYSWVGRARGWTDTFPRHCRWRLASGVHSKGASWRHTFKFLAEFRNQTDETTQREFVDSVIVPFVKEMPANATQLITMEQKSRPSFDLLSLYASRGLHLVVAVLIEQMDLNEEAAKDSLRRAASTVLYLLNRVNTLPGLANESSSMRDAMTRSFDAIISRLQDVNEEVLDPTNLYTGAETEKYFDHAPEAYAPIWFWMILLAPQLSKQLLFDPPSQGGKPRIHALDKTTKLEHSQRSIIHFAVQSVVVVSCRAHAVHVDVKNSAIDNLRDLLEIDEVARMVNEPVVVDAGEDEEEGSLVSPPPLMHLFEYARDAGFLPVPTSKTFLKAANLLAHSGGDLGFKERDGSTLLHAAASVGAVNTVRWLGMVREADVNAPDKLGRPPIFFAKNREVAEELVEHLQARVDKRDRDGNTAIHVAMKGSKKVLEYLLDTDQTPPANDLFNGKDKKESPLFDGVRQDYSGWKAGKAEIMLDMLLGHIYATGDVGELKQLSEVIDDEEDEDGVQDEDDRPTYYITDADAFLNRRTGKKRKHFLHAMVKHVGDCSTMEEAFGKGFDFVDAIIHRCTMPLAIAFCINLSVACYDKYEITEDGLPECDGWIEAQEHFATIAYDLLNFRAHDSSLMKYHRLLAVSDADIVELLARSESKKLLSHPRILDLAMKIWMGEDDMDDGDESDDDDEPGSWGGGVKSTTRYLSRPKTKFWITTLLYVIFLLFLCADVFLRTNGDDKRDFSFEQHVRSLFVEENLLGDDAKWEAGFDAIGSREDLGDYLKGPLVDLLHKNDEFEGPALDEANTMFRLLTGVRLRQLRVVDEECNAEWAPVESDVESCQHRYSDDNAFKVDTDPVLGEWFSEEELGGPSWTGKLMTYPGSGYVVDLIVDGVQKNETAAVIGNLLDNRWISGKTRVVFIESTAVNENLGYITVVNLMVELPATGGAIPSSRFLTFGMARLDLSTDPLLRLVNALILLQVIAYLAAEIEQIVNTVDAEWTRQDKVRKDKLRRGKDTAKDKSKDKGKGLAGKRNRAERFRKMLVHAPRAIWSGLGEYFRSFWNWFDVVIYIMFIVIYVMRDSTLSRTSEIAENFDPTRFQEMWDVSRSMETERSLMAVNLVLCFTRLLYAGTVSATFGPFILMVFRMVTNIVQFLIVLSVFMVGFALAFYVKFARTVPAFSTFGNSMLSMFLMLYGDFDAEAIAEADRTWGLLLFALYLVLATVLLLNLLIAILSNTYAIIQDAADQEYAMLFAAAIQDYRRSFSPVPFNLVTYVFHFVRFILRAVTKQSVKGGRAAKRTLCCQDPPAAGGGNVGKTYSDDGFAYGGVSGTGGSSVPGTPASARRVYDGASGQDLSNSSVGGSRRSFPDYSDSDYSLNDDYYDSDRYSDDGGETHSALVDAENAEDSRSRGDNEDGGVAKDIPKHLKELRQSMMEEHAFRRAIVSRASADSGSGESNAVAAQPSASSGGAAGGHPSPERTRPAPPFETTTPPRVTTRNRVIHENRDRRPSPDIRR